ncbi:CRISPR-associated helicase Cas3' [Thermococcus indicus]|uniref:CRISPR-associated helicase Cas3 n=1 Tax=Thermococcus indicus TaxID=2586643 RepID=A0A4Y5SM38_9EURY|nr:CRISPR-associated helicase Cas3' [Thermococcus indicus]QDA31030.1 CRISPR-associated helicase Cas3' [Thermococcus indicus]
MPQMTLDVYYQKSLQKEEPTSKVPNSEKVELLRKILAKSKREEGKDDNFPPYTLVGHVILALNRCVELEKFISSLENIKYPRFANPEDRYIFFKNLAKAIIIHDLGKISLDFQKRLYAPDKVPHEIWGLLKESKGVKTYGNHELFSLLWSFALLGNSNEDAMIRTAVLLHHYNEFFSQEEPRITKIIEGDNSNELKYLEFLLCKRDKLEALLMAYLEIIRDKFSAISFIAEAADELIDSMDFSRLELLKEQMETFGINPSREFPIYNPREQKTSVDFLVFLGMLRRCDYSSSGDFYVEVIDNLEAIFGDVDSKIKKKIRAKAGTTFKGLWQEELLRKYNSDYLAVIAPTGSGKTELAVLWAKNRGKLVYTLPLRVALNDLYRRLAKEYFDEEHVGLLHSTAFMEYVEGSGKEVDVEKKVNAASLLAMPVMLSTPDQVFLTGLNYYGADKVISVYPESAIVVDEVQVYTPEMVSVFLRTLDLIMQAGGKVLLITATLPPHIRWFLSGFTEDDAKKLRINTDRLPKPLFNFKVLDVAEEFRGKEENVKNLKIKRHKLDVIEDKVMFQYINENGKMSPTVGPAAFKEIQERLEEFNNNGLKAVMIVVNNVKKAIELCKSFTETSNEEHRETKEIKCGSWNNWDIYLLHSRLPEKRKQLIIGEVKKILNEYKDRKEIDRPILLITTQVVEASVDVDFDAMITEISPIDSQVQRWGRVYRNRGGKHYNEYIKEIREKNKVEENPNGEIPPNIIVFLGDEIDRGTTTVYGKGIGKDVLEKTKEVLKKLDGKLLGYIEERNAIEEVYSGEILGEYIKQVDELYNKLDYFTLEKKSEAQRVFRQMAGMYFVVPSLMKKFGDETAKKFGEFLSEPENRRLSWKDVVIGVYGLEEEPPQEKEKKEEWEKKLKIGKWKLKKILQEYSVNVPLWFVLEDFNLQHALNDTFKGYPVVLTWGKDNAEKLWKFGVDEVVGDLDAEEDVL